MRHRQYYAHPQNQFWRLLCAILQEEMPQEYMQKCNLLLTHHVALWDVIHFAEREGSLDSNIKNAVPNDMHRFFAQYPNIRLVLLNGDKAAKLFRKHFQTLDVPSVQVPSSSPAHASLTFEEKLARWQSALSGSVLPPVATGGLVGLPLPT